MTVVAETSEIVTTTILICRGTVSLRQQSDFLREPYQPTVSFTNQLSRKQNIIPSKSFRISRTCTS